MTTGRQWIALTSCLSSILWTAVEMHQLTRLAHQIITGSKEEADELSCSSQMEYLGELWSFVQLNKQMCWSTVSTIWQSRCWGWWALYNASNSATLKRNLIGCLFHSPQRVHDSVNRGVAAVKIKTALGQYMQNIVWLFTACALASI